MLARFLKGVTRSLRRNGIAYRQLVMTLAVIVVFTTTWTLILPALAIEAQKVEEQPGFELEGDRADASEVEDAGEEDIREENPDQGAGFAEKNKKSSDKSEKKDEKAEDKAAGILAHRGEDLADASEKTAVGTVAKGSGEEKSQDSELSGASH